jgi:hypothetical protein
MNRYMASSGLWVFRELRRQSTEWNPGFIIFSARQKVYPVSGAEDRGSSGFMIPTGIAMALVVFTRQGPSGVV